MSSDKLRKLRMGVPNHKKITIGDSEKLTVAVVILSADITLQIEEDVQEYCSLDQNRINEAVKNQYYNATIAYHCMRDPENLDQKLADSVAEILQSLDAEDISRVVNAYAELMMNKAPKLELLDQEGLDEIKKHLEITPLSDLSTVLLVHLASCHQTIVSEA